MLAEKFVELDIMLPSGRCVVTSGDRSYAENYIAVSQVAAVVGRWRRRTEIPKEKPRPDTTRRDVGS